MWLEMEIEGFKVYMKDLITAKDALESTGIVLVQYTWLETRKVAEPHEVIEKYIEQLEKIIKKYSDKLRLAGFKYIVLMSLGDYFRLKPKVPTVNAGLNHVLCFYKRRPKFIDVEGFRPYP